MLFRQLFDSVSWTYTYIIADTHGHEAIIIDPVKEKTEQYIKLLNELDLRLVMALDTHTHADHVTATGPLRNRTQCSIVMGEQTKAEYVDIKIKEGETIKIGHQVLTAMYTPGHTDDHISYRMKDRVFTGDCLLIRATGRTDFQNGDPYAHYDSLFNKLLKLPEETLVYPAHDYNGMLNSTIGEEKRYNPRLQVNNVEEYVEIMTQLNLPKPKLIDIAVPANLKCGLTDK